MAVVEAPWSAYAAGTRGAHFAWWLEENCKHSAGTLAGTPLILEEWQRVFFDEGMAVDELERPYWTTVVLDVPRKNGKSTSTAGVGVYEADQEEEQPNVGLAATSDEQASELFDAIGGFIVASPYLSERFHIRDYEGEIARTDGAGFIRRMRMDWRRLHGKNLSKLIADEIHAWSTQNLRKCWEALTTGDAARPGYQTWCITTEGEETEAEFSILTMLVEANEQLGEVERRPGLTISRNHEARVLIYRYSAPMPDADPGPVRDAYRDWARAKEKGSQDAQALRERYERAGKRCVEAVKLANPASWITEEFLLRKAIDPKISRAGFLRFHACVKADDDDQWIANWDAMEAGPIPLGVPIDAAVDVGISHDCSAVVKAWLNPETDRVRLEAHVWASREDAVAHEHVDIGSYLRTDRLKNYLHELRRDYHLLTVSYDPRYFVESAQNLSDEGFVMVVMEQNSKPMADAYQQFYDAAAEGDLEHDGDPIFAAHVKAARGKKTDRGWKVSKVQHHRRIDALVAAVMARYRAAFGSSTSVYNDREMLVL